MNDLDQVVCWATWPVSRPSDRHYRMMALFIAAEVAWLFLLGVKGIPEMARRSVEILLWLSFGLMFWAVAEIRADWRRQRTQQLACLPELERRYSDADAVLVYCGSQMGQPPYLAGLVVIRNEAGTLHARAPQSTFDTTVPLTADEVATVLHLAHALPGTPPPPFFISPRFQARAAIFGRKVARTEVRAQLSRNPGDLPTLRLLDMLTRRISELTGDTGPGPAQDIR